MNTTQANACHSWSGECWPVHSQRNSLTILCSWSRSAEQAPISANALAQFGWSVAAGASGLWPEVAALAIARDWARSAEAPITIASGEEG